tara:strand:- start:264 stop:479 length:216 start_codon:yes stop_codon:yes gene_type:complete
MKPDDFTKTLEMAILHGGHFYRKLAEAALAADPINKAKIFRAFPDLTKTYGPDSSFFIASYGKPSHLKVIK